MQWYPLLYLESGRAWCRYLLYAPFFGESPLRLLLECRTTQARILADSLSDWEVWCRLIRPPFFIANDEVEAGFSPLIQVFLSRFYAREKLGSRVAVWLAMAPLG